MENATLEIVGREITVDMSQNLSQGNRANLTIAEVKGKLTLPKKRKWGWKTVLPQADFNYEIKLTGDAQNVEELSECFFSTNPITCKIQGAPNRASSGTFHVETCETELELIFDASKVKDCPQKLTEDRRFTLPFQLIISDDKTTFTINDYLVVNIKKFTPSLKFQFISDYSDENRLVYSVSEACKQVGKLRVSHNVPFSCTPNIENQQLTLGCTVKEGDAEDNDPVRDRDDLLFFDPNGMGGHTYMIEQLEPGQWKEIPVYFNIMDAGNPASVDSPNIYTPTINRNECEGSFKLYRNRVLTKQRVSFQMPNMEISDCDITDRPNRDLGELFVVQQADMNYSLKLIFENEADATDNLHPNAAVLVWGVTIYDISFDERDGTEGEKRVLTRNNRSLKNLFQLTAVQDCWALKCGQSCCYEIKLKAGDIEGIVPRRDETETYVDLTLHLKYYTIEDHEGEFFSQVMRGQQPHEGESMYANRGLHNCELKIRLKKQPLSEWLCVDFGTSAVVAASAQKTQNDNRTLIDLKKLKRHMLDIAGGKNSNDDEAENLISSTVCFHNASDTVDYHYVDGKPESFMKYPVWFSPSADDVNTYYYLLPCLKTIIGYKHLPNIFAEKDFKAFEYSDGNERIGLIDAEGNPTPLMEVREVAKIIYRQLFNYYLSYCFISDEQLKPRCVNQLVLSVPNTYTPLNIQAVKDLVRDSMPRIYPEYLHTISESDAVACYYVSRQNEFLNSIEKLGMTREEVEKMKEQLTSKESVLVYDMGAGTLDLTWFVKTTENSDGRTIVKVDIKGKLGVSKAGNYLDYELASILKDLCLKKNRKKDDSKFREAMRVFGGIMLLDRSDFGTDTRMEVKNYVKEVKKKLSESSEMVLPQLKIDQRMVIEGEQTDDNQKHRQQSAQLKIKDILEHEDFKRVINEMTSDVLENFRARYGGECGKLDIDVLIFSGRSTSLKAIREGVKDNIGRICSRPDDLLYADLCAGSLSNDIELPANVNNSKLKTVVTQGALAYATMFSRKDSSYCLSGKKFYASFGLVKHYSNGSYEYVPLIDDRHPNSFEERDGVITSKKQTISVRDLNQIDLIQSYSSNEVEDYQTAKFDTITKLKELSCQGFPKKFPVQLIMKTKSDDVGKTTLTFMVNGGEMNLDPHDDFDNLSLRKSLWPVIFDTGENPNR